jgi:hypothetical protein
MPLAAQVRPAHVIGKDEDDVGARWLGGAGWAANECEECGKDEMFHGFLLG